MQPTIEQKFAIDQELLDAIRLIRCGLGQLQLMNTGNDFYHMPLLILSSGFERFLKVIRCFRYLKKFGRFPDSSYQHQPSGFRPFGRGAEGHNIAKLLSVIIDECFENGYSDSCDAARRDLAYIRSRELRDFVNILARFGQSNRYHYLNVVLGETSTTNPPDREWEELETSLLLSQPELLKELEGSNPELARKEITKQIVIRLERLARALARLFTIGKVGTEARVYTSYISSFLFLQDDDLGNIKYKPFDPNLTNRE